MIFLPAITKNKKTLAYAKLNKILLVVLLNKKLFKMYNIYIYLFNVSLLKIS